MYVCVRIYLRVNTYTHSSRICTLVYMLTRACAHTHIHTRVRTRTRTHTICVCHTLVHSHMHACFLTLSPLSLDSACALSLSRCLCVPLSESLSLCMSLFSSYCHHPKILSADGRDKAKLFPFSLSLSLFLSFSLALSVCTYIHWGCIYYFMWNCLEALLKALFTLYMH